MIRFQHPEYLYGLALLPLVAALYFYVLNWKKKTAARIGDPALVKDLIKNYDPRRFAIKTGLLLLAVTLAILALANPRSRAGVEKVSRNGIDVMIALDVSKSMLAQDIKPSRLDRARQLLGKLIDKMGNDRIGLVVFAGRAYLQMPLTSDHAAAKMYLSASSPDMVPTQGTVLSDALKMCYAGFNSKEKKYKSILLVSDGEDHDEGAEKMAARLADEGIVVNTVGIGSPEGANIIDPVTNEPKKDEQGNPVVTKLNEKELETIARKTNGIYQLYTNTGEVTDKLLAQLDSMDQRPVTEDALVNYRYFFQWLLLLGILALVAELLLSERRRQKRETAFPVLKKAMPLLLLLGGVGISARAQNAQKLIREGNKAYQQNQFGKASEQYRKALQKNASSSVAQYNLGNALYRDNKAGDAITAYEAAASGAGSNEEKARAFYNKGVVLQNNKQLPECITAYKNALKLNPQDDDARQNLQKALVQQRQQQEQQKKDKQQQQQPKQDDNKKDKQKQQDQDKNDQPRPQPSKLSKEDAEQKLKALQEQEKNLQDKLHKASSASPSRPEKDW